jgi:hypothetical protein
VAVEAIDVVVITCSQLSKTSCGAARWILSSLS